MTKTRNQIIAEMMAEQTYTERMEMSDSFRDYFNDWWMTERQDSDQRIEAHDVAKFFDAFVEAEQYVEADDDKKA